MKENNKVLVAGTGKSGISAAKLILKMGGSCILYNSDCNTDLNQISSMFSEEDKISYICGELKPIDVRGVHLAVMSPGISLESDFVRILDRLKIPVIGELELAFQVSKGMLSAVTGTNGKTTTTALIGEILKKQYEDVHVVGNIGNPFSDEALATTDKSVTVAEVSSFMLETILDFKPHVSAILNITPDHLDRHITMNNYIRCKEAIAMNQTSDDYIVLNYNDTVLREFGMRKDLKAKVIWFTSEGIAPGESLYLFDKTIYYVGIDSEGNCKDPQQIIKTDEMMLLGRHNFENVMAAVAVSMKMNVPVEKIRQTLKEFKSVEHRIEFVRERCKVRYYNDSKGTNPDAAIQALKAMPGQVILIAGGYDKKADYSEWVSLFKGKVKKLILIGQTRDAIYECCRLHGFTEVSYAENMNEAVQICASFADEGEFVLLSPACASWGMFKNYEERGNVFKECVNQL